MSSVAQLIAQKEALEAQIEAARQAEVADAVAKVKALIESHKLTIKDVFGSSKRGPKSGGASKVAPKYKDPATGATWTGRGKAPKWIDGKDRSKFAI